jgi:hypothetical protein
VKFPNHTDHRDQTTTGRTSALRAAPPAHDRSTERGRACQSRATVRREDKISIRAQTRPQLGTERTHLVVDQRRQREKVEQVGKETPHVGIPVLPQALVIEPIHLRDLPRLVVAPQNRHAVSIPQLERDKQRHRLDRVVPAVDVVPHEQVVGVRRVSANPEELREIMLYPDLIKHRSPRGDATHELAVNIATDGDRAPDWLHVGFLHQDLPRLRGVRGCGGLWTKTHLVAQFLYVCLC